MPLYRVIWPTYTVHAYTPEDAAHKAERFKLVGVRVTVQLLDDKETVILSEHIVDLGAA